METTSSASGAYWFVGPMYQDGTEQSARFIQEGVWQYLYADKDKYKNHEKYLAAIRSIQPGDRIALKTVTPKKQGLPFNNRGHIVSVMTIRAACCGEFRPDFFVGCWE